MRVGFVSETVSYFDYLFTVRTDIIKVSKDGIRVAEFPIIPGVYDELRLPLSEKQDLMLCRRGKSEKGHSQVADVHIDLLDIDPGTKAICYAESIYYKDFFVEDRSQSMDEPVINFEEAKNLTFYRFSESFTVEQIKNWRQIPNIGTDNVLAVLEIGDIDIELSVQEIGLELQAGYAFLVRKNEQWEEIDYDGNFDPAEYSEQLMFEKLVQVAKKHNISWQKKRVLADK